MRKQWVIVICLNLVLIGLIYNVTSISSLTFKKHMDILLADNENNFCCKLLGGGYVYTTTRGECPGTIVGMQECSGGSSSGSSGSTSSSSGSSGNNNNNSGNIGSSNNNNNSGNIGSSSNNNASNNNNQGVIQINPGNGSSNKSSCKVYYDSSCPVGAQCIPLSDSNCASLQLTSPCYRIMDCNNSGQTDNQDIQEEIKNEYCYIKKVDGKENDYCYGDNNYCFDFSEILAEKTKDTCYEDAACYLDSSKLYVMGKYSNRAGYQYYGTRCPACYKDDDDNYEWTDSPKRSEQLVKDVKTKDECVKPVSQKSYIFIGLIVVVAIALVVTIKSMIDRKNDS